MQAEMSGPYINSYSNPKPRRRPIPQRCFACSATRPCVNLNGRVHCHHPTLRLTSTLRAARRARTTRWTAAVCNLRFFVVCSYKDDDMPHDPRRALVLTRRGPRRAAVERRAAAIARPPLPRDARVISFVVFEDPSPPPRLYARVKRPRASPPAKRPPSSPVIVYEKKPIRA
jgi:hypothetical protein